MSDKFYSFLHALFLFGFALQLALLVIVLAGIFHHPSGISPSVAASLFIVGGILTLPYPLAMILMIRKLKRALGL